MIISTHVDIVLNPRNIKRLKKEGYFGDIGETIEILVSDLSIGSHCLIDVKCSICGDEKKVSYLNYNKQTQKGETVYFCSKCSKIKTKTSCLDKYGVDNPMKDEKIKNKLKCSILEKYGVENVFQNEEIKNKIKETNLIKYNSIYYNNIDKTKNTCIEKYGVDSPMKTEKVKNSIRNTCLEKYGVESYMQTSDFKNATIDYYSINNKEIKEKTKITNLEKYGVENVFQNEDIKNKIKETNLIKYGVEYTAQNEDIFLKTQKSRFKILKYKDSDIYYQGTYEKDFLDNFFESVDIKRAKSFVYYQDNKKHYYHPDFYLSEFNLIVEIKSKYIYDLELEQNLLKRQSCIDDGYNFIFIIDKNYVELKKLIE